MSDKVQALLDPDSPVLDADAAEWAIFYSITNCQEGLRGVPFGSFLIKQVVEDVSKEFPRIKKFATLSPVPGFRKWLAEKAAALQASPKLAPFAAAVAKLDTPQWMEDAALRAELQRCLAPLAAYYLLHAKQNQEPLDPVARFHLKNGARLERINWLGDTSPSGLQRSAGLTANYVYKLAGRRAQSRAVCARAQGSGFARNRSASQALLPTRPLLSACSLPFYPHSGRTCFGNDSISIQCRVY